MPTASLLSGGIDSSVIAYLASDAYRKRFGNDRRLMTLALGVGESENISYARLMSDHINSEHHELIVDIDQLLDVLPKEIVWRLKQEFSQGSGSADVLPAYFEETVNDEELIKVQNDFPMVRSKEELYYFKIFTGHFGSGQAVDTVGQWVCL